MEYVRGRGARTSRGWYPARRPLRPARLRRLRARPGGRPRGWMRELRRLFGRGAAGHHPAGGGRLAAYRRGGARRRFAAQRAELLRIVNNRATETASTATFATAYEEGEYLLLHSERRTDAVVLEALLRGGSAERAGDEDGARAAGAPHARAGGTTRRRTRWVLLALDRYFRVYEGQTPEFVARVWLGERFAGEQRFAGRSADRHHLDVPMRVLADGRSAVADHRQGRAGAAVLPRRAALRPARPGPGAAGARLRRGAHLRGGGRFRRTWCAARTAAGGCGPARASASR